MCSKGCTHQALLGHITVLKLALSHTYACTGVGAWSSSQGQESRLMKNKPLDQDPPLAAFARKSRAAVRVCIRIATGSYVSMLLHCRPHQLACAES